MARASMTEAWAQGLLPIVVGGTGLYLRALTDGLADIPPVPDVVRDAARARMAQLGPERFFADLNARNPRAVLGLRPSDSQRLVRAAEVFEATGRPLVDFHQHEKPAADNVGWTRVALMPDRIALHRAIEGRFDAMIEAGALDEAAAMRGLDLDPSLPLAKTLGLRPLIAHLEGEISLDDAKTRAKIDTRRYAKRQMTWIRTQMIAWKVLNSQDSERNCIEICTFMEN
jgi:tRNA dimethylallyltransferase